jgi:drug/metabolite transporter (DMT)-like permease
MSVEHSKVKGILFIVASSAIYSGMSCLIKYSAELGSYRLVLGRFVVGLVVLSALWASGKRPLRFGNIRLLLIRGVLGSTVILITVISILKIGIGKSTVILYSYPIYASLLGALFLKEKLRAMNFVALGFAVGGLYLLVTSSGELKGWNGLGPYELLAIVGAVASGLTVCVIRKLHETETSFEIFYAQCFCGAIIVVVPAILSSGTISVSGLAVLACIGGLAVAGQLLMTEGFRYLPVKTASVLAMSELVTNYTIGVMLFDEHISAESIVGAVLIAAGCIMAVSGPMRVMRKAR